MKIPRAAKQLVREVQQVSADSEYIVVGDPDGFNVYREIQFDPGTSKWLALVLKAAEDDRIAGMEMRTKARKKRLTVCFVGDTRADSAHPFLVSDILSVLEEPDEPSVGDSGDDPLDETGSERGSVDD